MVRMNEEASQREVGGIPTTTIVLQGRIVDGYVTDVIGAPVWQNDW